MTSSQTAESPKMGTVSDLCPATESPKMGTVSDLRGRTFKSAAMQSSSSDFTVRGWHGMTDFCASALFARRINM